MKRVLLAMLVLTAVRLPAQTAASPDPYAGETPAQRDARMAWWREARFGLLVHWGVFAVPAGRHEGKPVAGSGDAILRNGKMAVADYRAYAQQFNPVQYDPAAWVRLAKQAGMKYLIMTAKHHDGFALYDSAVTDWDIAGASPYGQDLLRPLVEAAQREGLRVGFYYSQAEDWVHRGGGKSGFPDGAGWDDAHKGSFDDYLRDIAVPQVRELLTGYPIDLLWWDTPHLMNPARAAPLLELLTLRPGIVHNNRLGGGFAGDLDTPEQQIPAAGHAGRDWETCMSLNDTWGFKLDDRTWKPVETLVQSLVDIASKGGNYLLSVGPTAAGEFPAASVERLQAIGRWMAANAESIHGTTASPFVQLPWGRCTKRVGAEGATLYLHVFNWPADGILRVPGLGNAPRRVRVLTTGAELEWRSREDGLQIGLPLVAPDPLCSTLAVEVDGPLQVEAVTLKQGRDRRIVLPAEMAELHNPGYDGQLRLETKEGPGRYNIGYWIDPRAWVKWTFKVDQPGTFEVVAEIANPAETSRFQIQLGTQKISATVGTTGGWSRFKEEIIGRVTLAAPGPYELSMRPDPQGWRPLNLCDVTLRPVK